eukprot:156476-Chlamydomonas_euryale.AAC.2
MLDLHARPVTPESLDLHYHSERPLLGPLVTGICKGVAKTFFHHELDVEAVQLRGRDEGAQHDVFRLKCVRSFVYVRGLQACGGCEARGEAVQLQGGDAGMRHTCFSWIACGGGRGICVCAWVGGCLGSSAGPGPRPATQLPPPPGRHSAVLACHSVAPAPGPPLCRLLLLAVTPLSSPAT